jgi:hypothetical protein
MPLVLTGVDVANGLDGRSLQARDLAGTQIAVHVSTEAYEDCPLDQIQQKASSKYDNGQITRAGGAIIVTVRKSDFQ